MNKNEIMNYLQEKGIIYVNLDGKDVEYYLSPIYDIPQSLHFHQVAILQNKNVNKSRLDVDISSEIIKGVIRPIPLIAANMFSVVNSDFVIKLYELGSLGFFHRAAPEKFLLKEAKKVSSKCEWVAFSIGVSEDQFDFAKKLVDVGVNIIVLDVAHSYANYIIDLGRKIKKELNVKVVIGNTHNVNMFYDVLDFADALKVGIGGGFSCETKSTAACTEGQFTSILKFKELSKKYGLPIISDGGVKEPADFTKAIAACASSVMAGSIFARCIDSAAEIVEINGIRKKIYAGMSSRYIQEKWKGCVKPGTCTEGKVTYLDIGESVESLLERYSGALRSGITYGGGNDIKSFQEKVRFTRI